MNDQLPDPFLDAALRTLREQTETLDAPPHIEDALLAAFARQHAPTTRPRWLRGIAMPKWHAGIGLAGLGSAVLALMLVLAIPADLPAPAQKAMQAQHASVDDSGDFFALASAEHIALEPAPRLVETEIARTALAALGVPLSPDNAGDLVRAQFLVGADGNPLALRLLPAFSATPDRG